MAKAEKYVFFFGKGKAEGKGDQKALLGGKGAGLAEMTNIGLPVPGGFTLTTETCAQYLAKGHKWPPGLDKQVRENLAKLERACRKKLGDPKDPLLVSVRSGAAQSMPGMMETILNLGLNDKSVEGLATKSGNRRFALDAYRRLIMMYGSTAKGIDRLVFEAAFDEIKESLTRVRLERPAGEEIADTDVDEAELAQLIDRYKSIYEREAGESFPQKPYDQLVGSINAVFGSWNAEKAITYRALEKITGLNGTGVNIVQMVFGNMGDDSGTGVCFTRDPSTGENVFYGDLLMDAQGEDVVAGIRTPERLDELAHLLPEAYEQLCAVRAMLEIHYKEMQDLEFTVERGTLYMLQCRTGKRSPAAAFKIAVDQATKPLLSAAEAKRFVKKGYLPTKYAAAATKPVLTRDEAISRMTTADIERLFYPVIDPDFPASELASRQLTTGINAVPGAASGQVAFNAADAQAMAADGASVILVRKETSPEDVGGMYAAKGILTATGGKTSHAAVVARGWGKCCIVGCSTLDIDYDRQEMNINGQIVRRGDALTLDGGQGNVYRGQIPLVDPKVTPEYETLMGWADQRRRLAVRTNADTPADAELAVRMGAQGIGLCRTEHMFFETEERRLAMQEMIVADTQDARRTALDKLLPFQRSDFVGIFEAMAGRPVTIRLIDPPLHEFLPQTDEQRRRLAEATGISIEAIERRTEQLHETNPMLGHRGCRLCITYPEILEMQVRAIMEAAVELRIRGEPVRPEIMIPLTIDGRELEILVDRTRVVADRVIKQASVKVPYVVGTMIETPRAAILADRLAESAEFFSFGTNDLTQTTMGLSRDDAGRFLPEYVDQDKSAIFAEDPFQSIDQDGVGMLVKLACERGRQQRKDLKLGICGEHGGESASVKFCHRIGLDYVSCSPYRVPVARLAAAQAVIEEKAATRPATRKPAAKPTSKVAPVTKAKSKKKRKTRR